MGQNITLEELVQYMYKETDSKRSAAVEKEMEQDWALREKYAVMQESVKRLNAMPLKSPRKQTIDDILHYAALKNSTVTQNR